MLLDIIKMYIYSMERGETNFSHHLQGMVAWLSANGVAGCEFEVTQFFKACALNDDGVTYVYEIKHIGDTQPHHDLFCYCEKQRHEDWYHSREGGEETPAKGTATRDQWREWFDEKRSNINSDGFRKSNFQADSGAKKQHVNNANFTVRGSGGFGFSWGRFRVLFRTSLSILR